MGFYTRIKNQPQTIDLNKPCKVFRDSLNIKREQGESIHDYNGIVKARDYIKTHKPKRENMYILFLTEMEYYLNKHGLVKLNHS